MNELDQDVVNLTKAIRQVESGGDFKARGKSGEFGAYQYTEPTWNEASRKYLGRVVPLEQATPEQQTEVTYKRIKEWKDSPKGYNVGQIASMWNAGVGRPDAYKEDWRGVSGGVSYDTPAYAKKVADVYHQLKGGSPNEPGGAAGAIGGVVSQTPDARGLGDKLKDELKYAIGSQGQETPTGFASIIQGGNKALQGDIGSGLADVGRGALNIAGAAGGAVGDVIGAGVSKLIPDDIERSVGNTFGKVLDNPEVSDILQKVHTWKEANPKSANAAGDIFNVVTTLIPAGKAVSAAKGAVVGGIAAGIGGTSAGRALLKQTAQEGIDLFASARNVLNAAPKSMWDRVLHPISGKSQFADDLADLAGEMAQASRKEMVAAMAKENLRVNMSQVADMAVNNARLAFDGDGNVAKSLSKAFGSALDKSKDVGVADLMRYAESPNANQYVQKAVDQIISKTQSKAVQQARNKAMQAEASRRLFEMLKGSTSQSTTRNLAGQAIEGAGTHLGGQFGSAGAYLGNKAGEQITKRLLGNKKGLINQAILEKATRGGSLKRAVKKGLLPIAVNTGN